MDPFTEFQSTQRNLGLDKKDKWFEAGLVWCTDRGLQEQRYSLVS